MASPPRLPRGAAAAVPGRFSLLLLAEGEVFVSDARVACLEVPEAATPAGHGPRSDVGGRLRVCSESVVFEPDERALPLVRIEFAACTRVDAVSSADGTTLALSCTHLVRMREGGIDHPYLRASAGPDGDIEFVFSLVSRASRCNAQEVPLGVFQACTFCDLVT